jgi:hypothetical protein
MPSGKALASATSLLVEESNSSHGWFVSAAVGRAGFFAFRGAARGFRLSAIASCCEDEVHANYEPKGPSHTPTVTVCVPVLRRSAHDWLVPQPQSMMRH